MSTLKKLSKFQTVITQIKNNNYEKALELLSKINSNLEEKYLENKLYGSIYFKKKEWLRSIKYFNRVLKTNEKDIVVLNNIKNKKNFDKVYYIFQVNLNFIAVEAIFWDYFMLIKNFKMSIAV